MHEQWVWMYREPGKNETICSEYKIKIKTDIRSARVRLQTFSAGIVQVVYHLPWDLGELHFNPQSILQNEALSVWLDFCLDALALKEDYPNRVSLWPSDVYMNKYFEKYALDRSIDRQSLQAFVIEQKFPEVFELLERLEIFSELNGRDPHTKINTSKLSVRQINELSEILNKQYHIDLENTSLKEKIKKFDEQHNIDQISLQEFISGKKESEIIIREMQSKLADFSKEINLKKSENISFTKNSELLKKGYGKLREENNILIQQLHTLQEKYEQQLLQNQSLQLATNQTVELLKRIKTFVKQKFPETFLLKQG